MAEAILTEALSKSYGDVRALDELDLEVRTGEIFGFLGPNGAGKTTTIRLLLDIIRPSSGHAEVLGLAPRKQGVELRSRVGYLPGDFIVDGRQTSREFLTFLGNLRGGLPDAATVDLAERLDLDLQAKIGSLSKGNRQKVGLVQAFMHEPELLILDEPTSALDAELSRDVLGLLLRVKRELGTPSVLVTHRAPELLALADDCVVLEGGRLVAQGSPVAVLQRPRALGVASLVGVDNLLRLPVLRHDPHEGVTLLDLGRGEAPVLALAAPLCASAPGSPVDVGFYADDVLLCRAPPPGLSARNALPCRVRRIDAVGHDVLLELDAGAVGLRARITPAAERELALEAGAPVVAVLKTSSIHYLG
jgi:ABC-2 type transport system ATP-binding protein